MLTNSTVLKGNKMNSRNGETVAFNQLRLASLLEARLPALRPAAFIFAAVTSACTLSACGESGSGSDSGQSASVSSADGKLGDETGSTDDVADGSGVNIGDVNVSSAVAVNADDAAFEKDTSSDRATKAVTATMSKLPAFGVGPFTAGAAIVRTIGTYPGGKPIAGRRYRNNVLIQGGTSASYTIAAADVGQQLVYEELVERYDNKALAWYRSAAITVPGPDPFMSKAPALGAGTLVPGTALTRVMGEYPGSTPVAGRRYRDDVLIPGATGASYTLVAADAGKQLVYEEEAKRNDTGARKWFRSAAVTVPPVTQPPEPWPPQPGPFNTPDIVVADMRLRNDFVLKGYESYKNGWYVGPGINAMGNNPDFDTSQATWSIFYNNPNYTGKVARAALPWVVIFDGVDHAASNVAVEMRNMLTYIKSRSSGKWVLFGGPTSTTGTLYGKPNTGLPARTQEMISRTATSSTIKVPENRGYFWHGWWGAGRVAVDPYDIAAMFVTVQARLVVADASRPDDRARAQVGLQVGADYYMTTSSIYPESYAPAVGIARTKKIANDWQAYSFTTFSDVGGQDPGGGISEAAFRAAPPPMQ